MPEYTGIIYCPADLKGSISTPFSIVKSRDISVLVKCITKQRVSKLQSVQNDACKMGKS
jgi:hypothetical protein